MAATGLRLDRFYSAGSSCSPTRGSVITGRHPNRMGTFAPGWSFRPEAIIGVYVWQPEQLARTFLRVAFAGVLESHDPDRPLDQGILRFAWLSLKLVAQGSAIALLLGTPIGFFLGLSKNFTRAFDPIIQILRPVSPLAWLPLGMVLFSGLKIMDANGRSIFGTSDAAALFTIAICAMWPTVLNTAVGVLSSMTDAFMALPGPVQTIVELVAGLVEFGIDHPDADALGRQVEVQHGVRDAPRPEGMIVAGHRGGGHPCDSTNSRTSSTAVSTSATVL